jgi:hypothetical protein
VSRIGIKESDVRVRAIARRCARGLRRVFARVGPRIASSPRLDSTRLDSTTPGASARPRVRMTIQPLVIPGRTRQGR